jgi:hypothetical protein
VTYMLDPERGEMGRLQGPFACPQCGADTPEGAWNCPSCQVTLYWAHEQLYAVKT